MRMKYCKFDWIFQTVVIIVLILVALLCVYPILYVFSMSISDAKRITFETLWILPKGLSLKAYGYIFDNPELWTSYGNTLFYVVFGTILNVVLTVFLAYALSRKDFVARNVLMFFVTFTMLFSGGLIPLFVLITKIGIYNTRWAMLLPTAVIVWNTVIARTFFSELPFSLVESAKLDGANDLVILFRIVIPVSNAIIAVLFIFYAVGHWNSYLNALLYLPDKKLQPLQLFLAKVLVNNDVALAAEGSASTDMTYIQSQLKYAAIMVAILPILSIYPMFQKHFVKGVMIGSIKG